MRLARVRERTPMANNLGARRQGATEEGVGADLLPSSNSIQDLPSFFPGVPMTLLRYLQLSPYADEYSYTINTSVVVSARLLDQRALRY
jgi:hypothetical protein